VRVNASGRSGTSICTGPARRLERLEERRLPAVLFQPQFRLEQTSIIGDGLLQTPRVYPIFWGTYWGNHLDEANPGPYTAQTPGFKGVSHISFTNIGNVSLNQINHLNQNLWFAAPI
jgi:hypothetical protein